MQHLDDKYGGVLGYLESIGVGDAEVEQIRNNLSISRWERVGRGSTGLASGDAGALSPWSDAKTQRDTSVY